MESFSSAEAAAVLGVDTASERDRVRDSGPDAGPIDAARIDTMVHQKRPLSAWPAPIKSMYRQEVTRRIERDQHFLFLLGLLVCLSTLLIDQVVNPAMVKEGAILRVLAVAPITLLGLIAGSRKWSGVTAFCVGASPIAFAVVIVHLSFLLPPESSARYLAAAALLMGFANIVLPFSMRGLVIFDFAYIVAAYAAGVWGGHEGAGNNFDFLALLAIIAVFTIPLAHRFERLRQHNFLLNLHARTVSEELLETNRLLRDLSNRDPLTGLPNRRFFNRLFEELVEERICNPAKAEAQAEPCRVAVLMIDLDHFKAFNDTHGHVAGDEALRIVGHELASILERVDGIAARYGGEEFVAAVCEETEGQAARVAEDIRRTIAHQLIPVGPSGRSVITTSIGIAIAPAGEVPERADLITAADEALYTAKRAGRNRVKQIDFGSEAIEAAE